MTKKTPSDREYRSEAERQAAKRAERSAAQLRANLQRRKAQTRARREGSADEAEGRPPPQRPRWMSPVTSGDNHGGLTTQPVRVFGRISAVKWSKHPRRFLSS